MHFTFYGVGMALVTALVLLGWVAIAIWLAIWVVRGIAASTVRETMRQLERTTPREAGLTRDGIKFPRIAEDDRDYWVYLQRLNAEFDKLAEQLEGRTDRAMPALDPLRRRIAKLHYPVSQALRPACVLLLGSVALVCFATQYRTPSGLATLTALSIPVAVAILSVVIVGWFITQPDEDMAVWLSWKRDHDDYIQLVRRRNRIRSEAMRVEDILVALKEYWLWRSDQL
jgi:hypothetical protein